MERILSLSQGGKDRPKVAIYSPTNIGGHWKYMQAFVKHLRTSCGALNVLDSKAFQTHWRAPVLRRSTVPQRSILAKGILLLRYIRNMGAFIRVARFLKVKVIRIQEIEPILQGLFLHRIRDGFQLLLLLHNVLQCHPYSYITSKLEPQLWGFIYCQADALMCLQPAWSQKSYTWVWARCLMDSSYTNGLSSALTCANAGATGARSKGDVLNVRRLYRLRNVSKSWRMCCGEARTQ